VAASSHDDYAMLRRVQMTVAQLRKHMDRRFTRMSRRLNGRFAAVDTRLDSVDARIDSLNA